MRVPPGGFWGAGSSPDRRAGLGADPSDRAEDSFGYPVTAGPPAAERIYLEVNEPVPAADNGGLWWLLLIAAGAVIVLSQKKER